MLSMKEAIENYVEGCVGKVDCPAYKLFMKAILAGMMIAFGAAGSSVAAHDIANVGIARLVAGVVFPMGLMMVVMTGAELFTGDCLAIMATVQKKHTALKLIRMLIVVYLGNLLGSLMLTCIDYVSGQYNYSSGILGAYTIKVAFGKCNLDFTTALASGILCNILVCAAVMLAARAKDVTGKLLCCFFIILLFVVSGYEHCVANMYYVPAGMIAKLNPLYVKDAMEQYGYTQTGYDQTGYSNQGTTGRDSYDQTGYSNQGTTGRDSYDQGNYTQTGYDQTGYNNQGSADQAQNGQSGYDQSYFSDK